ncbi:hypothetical protein ACKVEX_13920 [Rhodocyclaceae bacterium SMB388]
MTRLHAVARSAASPVPAFSAIVYSLSLICLPLAFQLAASMPASVPEGMWLLLVLSIWASLATGLLLIAALLRLLSGVLASRRHGHWRGHPS